MVNGKMYRPKWKSKFLYTRIFYVEMIVHVIYNLNSATSEHYTIIQLILKRNPLDTKYIIDILYNIEYEHKL